MFQFHTDWCDTIKCANAQSQSPTRLLKIALIWSLTFLVHAEKVQSHRPGEECHRWDSSQVEERCCHLKLWDTTVTKCINNTISLNTNKFRVLLCCCCFSWPAERGGVFSILCSRGRTWCQWQWRRTPGSPRCQPDTSTVGTETLHDNWLVVVRSGLKTFISPSWCLLPCGSSEGTTSDPQTADTLPAPEQYLHTIRCRQTGTISDNFQVYLCFYKECYTIKTCCS